MGGGCQKSFESRNCLLEVPKKRGPDFFEGCVVRPVVYGKCGGLNLSCLQKGGGPMEVKKLFVGGTKKGVQNFFYGCGGGLNLSCLQKGRGLTEVK